MGKIVSVVITVLVLCVAQGASGGTWYVDGSVLPSGNGQSWERALKTIQEGIDAASDGDTVIVARGTYVENIHFGGKNIILRSTDPLDDNVVAKTIVDGNQSGSVVTFSGTEDETCVLSGFTIRNGSARNGGGICGGIYANDTRATFECNVVTDNRAEKYGGGMYRCDGMIRNNAISENSCMLGGPWGGGGLSDCDGTIRGNIITRNSADRGGGLAYCNATIEGNLIIGNSAPGYDSEGGGLVFCGGVIENNTISGNRATGCGGGLMWCDGPIRNNTISGNSAAFGAGLHSCDGLIENNSITANSADRGGGLSSCQDTIRNNAITVNSSDFHGGGVHDCTGHIEHNVIAGNSSDLGGGLYNCNGTIRNNAVICNSARRYGGGLFRCNASISSNTIAANSAGKHGGGLYECRGPMFNSIFWGNAADEGAQLYGSWDLTYSCIQGWTGGGEGNIAEDPRFIDPDGPDNDPQTYEDNDYHLCPDSPCIDAGKNEEWTWTALDLDGNPRIMDGDGDNLEVVDMGAYEYPGPPGSITVRSNIRADYILRELPDGEPIEGRTEATADPKVFEKVYGSMEPGTWQITWQSQPDAWPKKPVTEEKDLPKGGAIVFEKDYIVKMPCDGYVLCSRTHQEHHGFPESSGANVHRSDMARCKGYSLHGLGPGLGGEALERGRNHFGGICRLGRLLLRGRQPRGASGSRRNLPRGRSRVLHQGPQSEFGSPN